MQGKRQSEAFAAPAVSLTQVLYFSGDGDTGPGASRTGHRRLSHKTLGLVRHRVDTLGADGTRLRLQRKKGLGVQGADTASL